ncbi:MAG: Cof-type HAD-IIB family hydrolase [Thermomicrobiales bacterium]
MSDATSSETAFRLVATDLDGTLLRDDKTISARTIAALRRVREAGIALVLVTGRPPRRLKSVARELDVTGLAICCNGAIVYDLAADAIVQHNTLAADVARQLVVALREAAPGVCFAIERGLVFGHEPAYTQISQITEEDLPLSADAHMLCAEAVTKLIVRHPELPLDDLLRISRGVAGERAAVTYSGAPFVEISAAGITKASALAGLCDRLGITATEVIAFGDMPNDLPMLAWAGRSVAVANAHPEVLAVMDEVTAANEDDGVAIVLERLLEKKHHLKRNTISVADFRAEFITTKTPRTRRTQSK